MTPEQLLYRMDLQWTYIAVPLGSRIMHCNPYVCMYVCPKIYNRRALSKKVTVAPRSQTNRNVFSARLNRSVDRSAHVPFVIQWSALLGGRHKMLCNLTTEWLVRCLYNLHICGNVPAKYSILRTCTVVQPFMEMCWWFHSSMSTVKMWCQHSL